MNCLGVNERDAAKASRRVTGARRYDCCILDLLACTTALRWRAPGSLAQRQVLLAYPALPPARVALSLLSNVSASCDVAHVPSTGTVIY